jgi:hypothetical protein
MMLQAPVGAPGSGLVAAGIPDSSLPGLTIVRLSWDRIEIFRS